MVVDRREAVEIAALAEAIWLWIRAFIHIHLYAHRTAILLDDCCRTMGLMDKLDDGRWAMASKDRSKLINKAAWHTLPVGYKWRKD